MRIIFDESTIKQGNGPGRAITSVVYLDFDGVGFPDVGWSDFVVVISGWWIEALERFQRGRLQQVELRFMDGPYWIEVVRGDGGTVALRCVEDRRGMGVVHEERMGLAELIREVRTLVVDVASACVRGGIDSDDVAKIRAYLPS